MLFKSRYVVPVDAPPIENAAIQIRDGKIVAIGTADSFTDSNTIDYGDAVICPGFVNAHTHLELTDLAGKLPPTSDFVDWLSRMLKLRLANPSTRESLQQSVQSGIDQSLRFGVTTVGDITAQPQWSREVLSKCQSRSVSFGEIIAIGKIRDKLHQRLEYAASLQHQTERMRIGISPHAPYTVEPDGIVAGVNRAKSLNARLCMHLGETQDETLFTTNLQGPIAEYLKSLQLWDDEMPCLRREPVDFAHHLGVLTSSTVLAHVNYVSNQDISTLASCGSHVAYCPRTHDAFGHDPHRFREMLTASINVCIGTDSLASNPSLSILDELRFLHKKFPDFSPDELINMGTLRGANALGFSDCTGSLTVGKEADLVIIPIDDTTSQTNWTGIFDQTNQPSAVYIDGDLVYENK